MLFNSYVFLLYFLPITVLTYFVLGRFRLFKWQKLSLIVASLYFYAYFNLSYLAIIMTSIMVNFAVSKALLSQKIENKSILKKLLLVMGIAANLGLLFYFKYFDFFIENVNALFGTDYILKNIVLPLGISFFTFQQLSYVVDSFRGQTAGYSFIDYSLFVCFFPQLVAGPIVLHKEIIPQFQTEENARPNYDNIAHGMFMLAVGLFKKVIIADTLGKAVAFGFGIYQDLSSLETILTTLSYTFQIYFDFSGYCDMASGLALMFNIVIPGNFNSPYKSLNIIEFWSRWHMTLSRFFGEYLYIPLGGNRKGKLRTYANIMIVFLLSGLWHGANWTFVIWGGMHGLANVLTRVFRGAWDKMHAAFQWLITFSFVNLGWLLFRADSVSQAWFMLERMIRMNSYGISEEFIYQFSMREYSLLLRIEPFACLDESVYGLKMWLLLFAGLFICMNLKNCGEIDFRPTLKNLLCTAVLAVWSIVSLAGVSTFLYFNF